ncbi:MAG: endonuclease NucS [Bacillota bacterium]
MENFIAQHPEVIDCDAILAQQFEIGGVGIADLVGLRVRHPYSGTPAIAVIEIKKGKIDPAAVAQLHRYVYALSTAMDDLRSKEQTMDWFPIFGILVGDSLDHDAKVLCWELNFEVYQYTCQFSVATKPLLGPRRWLDTQVVVSQVNPHNFLYVVKKANEILASRGTATSAGDGVTDEE